MKRFIVMIVCVLLAANAFATVRYVSKDGTGNFTTIQTAINGSVAGDTIVVRGDQGPWNENLNLDRRLTVMGQGSGCGGVSATESFGGFTCNPGSSNSVIAGFFFNQYNTGGTAVTVASTVQGISVRRCRIYTANGNSSTSVASGAGLQVQESSFIVGNDPSTHIAYLNSNASLTFANCVMSQIGGGTGGNILSAASDNIFVTNCVFVGLNLPFSGSGASWFLDHNIFWDTSWNGVWSSSAVASSYNAITAGMTNFPGTNNITISSNQFVNYTAPFDACNSDMHLAPASVLINAGDPNAANDRDGSRRDLGVYGGPLNWEPNGAMDFPFVTNFAVTPNVPQNGVLELRVTGRVGRGQ